MRILVTMADFKRATPDPAKIHGLTVIDASCASLNPFQCDVEDELKRCLFEHGFQGIKVHEIVASARGEPPTVDPRAVGGKWEQNTPRECAEAIRPLGPDRIVWASDAPLDDFAQRLGIILDADLSDDDRRKILGRNALRLLNMP